MKRFLTVALACIGLFMFAGCNTVTKSDTAIECAEVISAYEDAGFEVFHKETDTEEWGWACYVQATDPETQNAMYFHFFETHEDAVAYSETRQYNVVIWLFSVIYGNPSWMTTKVYNQIELEYDHDYLYEPFQRLLEDKE